MENILEPYEALVQSYIDNMHNSQKLQSLTNEVIQYASQEADYWSTVVSNTTDILHSEETLILYFRSNLNQILLVDIYDDLTTIQIDIYNGIQEINQEINTINSQTFFSTILDIVRMTQHWFSFGGKIVII